MTEEIFKIHELTGLVVSDRGRVIVPKVKGHPEHITYGSDCNGYKQIMFKKKKYKVHRLIAETFIENPHHLPCVNHKDEDKSNNCADNLEWCDVKYNINYGTAIQRKAEKQSKKVFQYDKQGVLLNVWASTNECGRNGYVQGHVSQCCNGKRKTHKGYIWSYEKKA